MIFLAAVVLGALLGWARGGRVAALADQRLRLWGIVVAAFLVRLGLRWAGHAGILAVAGAAPWLHSATYLALLLVVIVNRSIPFLYVCGLGALANFAVIAANGGRMPVAVPAGVSAAEHWSLGFPGDYMHRVMDGGTWLAPLGDWMYVDLPLLPASSYSPGDVLLALGALLAVQAVVARARKSPGALLDS